MERRFAFVAPTERERFLGLWGKPILALVLAVCVVLNPFHALSVPAKVFVAGVAVFVVGLLFWRINDIARRDEQARYGFVELTAEELRVALAHNSPLYIPWGDFEVVEQKSSWLTLKFRSTTMETETFTSHHIRVRLRELENPDALIDALRTQTPSKLITKN